MCVAKKWAKNKEDVQFRGFVLLWVYQKCWKWIINLNAKKSKLFTYSILYLHRILFHLMCVCDGVWLVFRWKYGWNGAQYYYYCYRHTMKKSHKRSMNKLLYYFSPSPALPFSVAVCRFPTLVCTLISISRHNHSVYTMWSSIMAALMFIYIRSKSNLYLIASS